LQNPKLQVQVSGQVIWIDEAGLLSVPTLARVAALAEKQNCRIILSGDTAQHRAVERGDALRILEKHVGLQAAELTEIWRQKADSHKAIVASLRVGNLEGAFKQLNKLGMLRELAPEDRHETLAADYVTAIKKGKSALVISPTHAEGERVTARIRQQLKHAGRLHRDEREFLQLKNLQRTEAQRADARSYQPGLIVQFHQNLAGFRRGERVTVKYADERSVQVERGNGKPALLPMDQAVRFQVHESRTLVLVSGDMVRITQNGFARGGQRLNNGDLKQVAGFTKDGDIKLANGWVVAKDYGNLTHGYCVTSYGSQSKGVDCVFVAESSDSFRAADREQFYVSASRFKQALTIYTDDKQQLLEAVSKSSERPSAIDLVQRSFRNVRPIRQTRALRPTRLTPFQRLAQTMDQARQRAGEMLKTGDQNQTSARKVERAPQIALPVSENAKPRRTINPPNQSQQRSRGVSI